GGDRFEHADRDPLDVEQQQVGEHEQRAAVVGDERRAIRVHAGEQVGAVGLDAHAFLLAEPRLPVEADAPAVPVLDSYDVSTWQRNAPSSLVGGDVAGGFEVFEEGDVAGGEVVAVHGVLDEQFPVGSGEVAL